jgi:hypothetical protein
MADPLVASQTTVPPVGQAQTKPPATSFPTFPTSFGDKEAQRLKDLTAQKAEMEKVYQQKFSPEAWASTNPLEKGTRNILSGLSWLTTPISWVTPASWGFDYGVNPEQAQQKMNDVTSEYKELVRAQKVTTVLPDLTNHMIASALSGKPLMSIAEILPEGMRDDFNESEKAYLAAIGQRLANATPEEIMSGEALGYQPSQELAGYADIWKTMPQITAQQVMTSAAFSTNLDQIANTLRMAYPPASTATPTQATETDYNSYLKARAKELGVSLEEGDTNDSISQKIADALGLANEGTTKVLTDSTTGNMITVTQKVDGSVWLDGNFLGYNSEDGTLTSGAEIESKSKDILDALHLGAVNWADQTKNFFINDFANGLFYAPPAQTTIPTYDEWVKQKSADSEKFQFMGFNWNVKQNSFWSKLLGFSQEDLSQDAYNQWVKSVKNVASPIKAIVSFNDQMKQYFAGLYNQSVDQHQQWLADHPELMPREEWSDGSAHWSDPSWYLYVIAKNGTSTIASLGTGILVAAATKNPIAGAEVAFAIGFPSNTEQAYEALMETGKTREEIAGLATVVGGVVSTLDAAGDIPILKFASPMLMAAFKKELIKQTTDLSMKTMLAKGITRFTAQEAAEAVTEVLQQAIQNASVKIFDPNQRVTEGLWQTFYETAISTAPFALFGVGSSLYGDIHSGVSPESQTKMDKVVEALRVKEVPQEKAEMIAVTTVMETDQGRAEVQQAVEEAEAKIPADDPKRVAKIARLTERITGLNEELDVMYNSIRVHQERLDKFKATGLPHEIVEEQETIDNLMNTVSELEGSKDTTVANLAKLNKIQTKAKAGKTISKEGTVIALRPEKSNSKNLSVYTITEDGADVATVITDNLHTDANSLTVLEINTKEQNTRTLTKSFMQRLLVQLEAEAISQGKKYIDIIYRDKNEKMFEMAGFSKVTDAHRTFMRKEVGSVVTESIVQEPVVEPEHINDHPAELDNAETSVERTLPRGTIILQGEHGEPPIIIRGAIPDISAYSAEGAPKLQSLDDWLSETKEGFAKHPDVIALLKPNERLLEYQNTARVAYEDLRERIKNATSPEASKAMTKELASLARKTGIKTKIFRTKNWSELPPEAVQILTTNAIPEGSLDFKESWKWMDARMAFGELEKTTGLPFYTIYERTRDAIGYVQRLQDRYLNRILKNPLFKPILSDKEALSRVTLELNSRDENSGIEAPEDVTENESLLADEIESVYKEWQPIVRSMRFIEAYEENHQIAEIQKKIKDAPPEELKAAKDAYEKQGLDALWQYLFDKHWGVIESGYDPREIHNPSLRIRLAPLTAVRGGGRLISRDDPNFMLGDLEGVVRRFDTYNKSMGVRWYLKDEIESLAKLLAMSKDKWNENSKQMIEHFLKSYVRELQGIPSEITNPFMRIIQKVQRWAYPTIFMHPWLGFRNVVQPLWSFPYRTELFTSLRTFSKLPSHLRDMAMLRFATVIDQSGRPVRDLLFQGEIMSSKGISKIFTPLDAMSNLMGKIPTMSVSDRISRGWAFKAGLTKAWGATEEFIKTGDAKKWLKDSGATYLTTKQQEHVLGLLLRDKVSWAVPGMHDLLGTEAAAIKVAEEISNNTLYLYDRSSRAMVEWGATGRALGSLFVFPRSTAQLLGNQFAKMFSKDSTAQERVDGAQKVVMLVIAGEILSQVLMGVSGRDKKEYSVFNFLDWKIGGLTISLASDTFQMLSDIVQVGLGNQETKERVMQQLPGEITRTGDTLLGGYKILMDALETFTDEKSGMDTRWIRHELMPLIDSQYTPEQQEEAKRTLTEKIQHIVTGAKEVDPTALEQALTDLAEEESKLGSLDSLGNDYTINNFGSTVKSILKDIPSFMVTDDYGFSELVRFYVNCSDSWNVLYELPTTEREDWRKAHPEIEAMLLFWGKYSKSVYARNSLEGKEVRWLLDSWVQQFNITGSMEPTADWQDLVPIFAN